MKPFPKRPASHVGGDRAVQMVMSHCDPTWIVTPIPKDYGRDLRVEVTQDGLVTGEEFFVQVKGRRKIDTDREYPPRAWVRQATINYWLGKLCPTLIVVADLSERILAFDWLQYAYAAYPQLGTGEDEVGLPLGKNSASHEFRQEILAYVRPYYAAVRRDVQDGSQNLYLTRLLFHVSGLFRLCARTAIELQRFDSDDANDLRQLVHAFVTAFAAHDEFLSWLRAGRFADGPAIGESPILNLVAHLLAIYDQGRDKLFERQDREDGFWRIRPDYEGLCAYLLPTFGVLNDLEEILFQGLMLGKLVYVPGEASSAHGA